MNTVSPLIKKSNHIGISISSNSVSVVRLDDHQTIAWSETYSSDTPFFTNDQVNIPVLTETLKKVAEKLDKLTTRAAVCFPERAAYSREHTLPKLKISEIDEAIQWQLSDIFPLKVDDIYTDWKLLSQEDSETKIVVVAVNKSFLDGLKDACVTAGIQPMSFEPSASTLARAQKNQSNSHIILEIDRYGSSASLIENEISSLTTTSLYTSTQNLEQILAQINASLQNLLNHKKLQDSGVTPQKTMPDIYLTGEKATPKLAELLSAQSQSKITMLSLPIEDPKLHVAYIAALSSLLPPDSELTINLLPLTLQRQYQQESNIEDSKRTATIGSIIGSISLVVSIIFYSIIGFTSSNLDKEIAAVTAAPVNEASVNIPLTLKKAQLISQITPQKQAIPIQQLTILSSAGIPTENIHKLVFDATRKQLQLTVSNINRESLYTLKSNLEKSELFSSIGIPLSAFGTDSNPTVTITLLLK